MNPAFVNALEMLPIPKTADRTPGRCVWCGHQATLLDLGPRLYVADGQLHRWTPRACQDCAEHQAALTYQTHRTTCARCTKWEHCPDSQALHQLALENRR